MNSTAANNLVTVALLLRIISNRFENIRCHFINLSPARRSSELFFSLTGRNIISITLIYSTKS